jgi:hypothetical protein
MVRFVNFRASDI